MDSLADYPACSVVSEIAMLAITMASVSALPAAMEEVTDSSDSFGLAN